MLKEKKNMEAVAEKKCSKRCDDEKEICCEKNPDIIFEYDSSDFKLAIFRDGTMAIAGSGTISKESSLWIKLAKLLMQINKHFSAEKMINISLTAENKELIKKNEELCYDLGVKVGEMERDKKLYRSNNKKNMFIAGMLAHKRILSLSREGL